MRAFLISLLVIGYAVPVLAREWHAREGGFSIKAELVELRGDSVVLKREDNGQEISVPLDKLSLDDVRFVHAELARPNNAPSGGPQKTPAPTMAPASKPTSSFAPPRRPTTRVDSSASTAVRAASPARMDRNGYPMTPRSNAAAPPLATASQRGWQVSADPNPFDFELPQGVQVQATLPKEILGASAAYAEHLGHFVFFDKRPRIFQAFHLPSQKIVGKIEFDSTYPEQIEYSVDGLSMAVEMRDGPTDLRTVEIWSFATGQLVRSFPMADKLTRISAIRFAGPDRIVIAKKKEDLLGCYDIATGRVISETTIPEFYNNKSIAISPSGAYAAILASKSKQVHLIDLRSGVEAGVVGGEDQIPKDSSLMRLCFSPDGEELLAYSSLRQRRHLITWDMRSGERLVDLNFKEDPSRAGDIVYSYGGRSIEWRPDRSGWLFAGRVMVERHRTEAIWTDDSPRGNYDNRSSRRFVDNDRLLVFSQKSYKESTLSLMKLPIEKIEATRSLLAKGGSAVDLGLPPLTQIFVGQVQEIASNTQWSYQPDIAPQIAAADLKSSIDIQASYQQLKSLNICRASNRAVVGFSELDEKQRLKGLHSSDAQHLELIDLAEGKSIHRMTLPMATRLMAVAGSGDWAAFVLPSKRDRVDLFDLTTGKSVVAFRPFGNGDDKIKEAAFGSDRATLWILTDAGELTQWHLPDCRAVARRDYGDRASIQSSPSGRTLCVASSKSYDLLDADTGKMLGTLANPDRSWHGHAGYVAFSDDGRKLAIARKSGRQPQEVLLCNLVTNAVAHKFNLPYTPYGLSWGSDLVLLIDVVTPMDEKQEPRHLVAVDLLSERVAWHYRLLLEGQHGFRGSDGRHWYVAGDRRRRDSMLQAVLLPQRDELARFSDLKPLAPLLGPGDALNIRIDASIPSVDPKRPNVKQELLESLQDRAVALGYRIDPAAEHTFVVEARESGTGKSVQVQELGKRSSKITIPISEVKVAAKIVNRQGAVVWTVKDTMRTSVGYIANIPQGTSPAAYFRNQLWDSVSNWMFGTPFPGVILSPAASTGSGVSSLSATGAKIEGVAPPTN
ncbi:SHD1 domain-containing protein [Blastopirellula sp. J2-11]|uniref:SHD1 domain-containing protein n=1 Tax=Blastopirellula sp. J2-11 TaxID=2943192 RepID=UPI0021C6F883|nr:SHD1 domain-containing protein [Blastopirellula sp. J2-11]UUO06116.1 SHD1 domain-containing protein [Blastopirellula sp. J2-11]